MTKSFISVCLIVAPLSRTSLSLSFRHNSQVIVCGPRVSLMGKEYLTFGRNLNLIQSISYKLESNGFSFNPSFNYEIF